MGSAALLQGNARLKVDGVQSIQTKRSSTKETSSSSHTSALISRARAMAKEYAEHNRLLRDAVEKSKEAHGPSQNELDQLIQTFIDNNEPEKDHCPGRILEAKHQLNILHQTI